MTRCHYWAINLLVVFSIYLGATALRVDARNRRLKKPPKWFDILVVIGDLTFMACVPYAVVRNMGHGQLYLKNPVAKYANYATILARFILIALFALSRKRRDDQLSKWLEAMFDMQKFYFDRFKDIPKDTTHRKWLYLNGVFTGVHLTAVVNDIFSAFARGQASVAIDLYPLCGMLGIQHLFMLQHAILLCHLRECLSMLNNQLLLKCMDPKLGLIYSQTIVQLQELNRIYSPVNLWILVCLIISNSMAGFIGMLKVMLPQTFNSNSYIYLFGNIFYFTLLLHMYLYFAICDWVLVTAKETEIVLLDYASIRSMSRSNEEEIEKLALCRRLMRHDINICGMLNLNLSTLFSIVAQTTLYIIIMIQIDYEYLNI
uniref:Gustatory receptor n=1 Tax=Stomoxys calcitrans TaxID=35570 RepID=A0A1I8P5R6_STOCA